MTESSVPRVLWEPDEPPPETEWTALRARLAERPATVMLWEADPLPATAARLLSLGVSSATVDPCGNRPASGDFLSVQRANLARLSAALAP